MTQIEDIFSLTEQQLNEEIVNLNLQQKRLIYINYLYSIGKLSTDQYYLINNIHFGRIFLQYEKFEDVERQLNINPLIKQSITSLDVEVYNKHNNYFPNEENLISKQNFIETNLMNDYYNKSVEKIKNIDKEIQKLSDENKTYLCNNVIEKMSQILTIIFNDKKLMKSYMENIKFLDLSYKSYLYSFNIKNNKFLLKSSKNIDKNLLHEGIVGLYGLNSLNKIIPNFCPIFAVAIPNFDKPFKFLSKDQYTKKQLNHFKNKKDEEDDKEKGDTYLIYQYIESSISFTDFLKTCSVDDVLPYILQIVFALKIANEKINFTHYDLNVNNIILQDIKDIDNFYIEYSDSIYIKSNKIATIIDYEISHFKYLNQNLGSLEEFSYLGILRNKDNLRIDIYRFLVLLIFTMKLYSNKNYLSLAPLIYFFNNKENIDYICESQNDSYLILSPSHEIPFNINQFIDYVLDFIKTYNYTNPIKNKLSKDDYIVNCQN